MYLALENQAYHPPVRTVEVEKGIPRDQAAIDLAKAAEAKAKAKKYEPPTYRTFPVVGSRVAVWIVAQLHLMFAAFVLAVPMFAFIIELIGYFNGDQRYNRLAYEFAKLLSTSFSFTASFGGVPDVPAHHPVPRLHELHDGDLLAGRSFRTSGSSSWRRDSSTATTTAGGSFTRSCTCSSGSG